MRCFKSGIIPLAILAGSLWGQDFRATVSGQVADKFGDAIPGARVRAVQRNTNQAIEATSNHNGYYSLPYLQPSAYDIEVTAQGFNKLRRENITLMVGEKLDLPLLLDVGQISTQVTVSAETFDTVQTADASGGLNFDSLQTPEYPLNAPQITILMDL